MTRNDTKRHEMILKMWQDEKYRLRTLPYSHWCYTTIEKHCSKEPHRWPIKLLISTISLHARTFLRLTGNKPAWDFACTFKIIVDDFLLRHLATDVITLELNMVSWLCSFIISFVWPYWWNLRTQSFSYTQAYIHPQSCSNEHLHEHMPLTHTHTHSRTRTLTHTHTHRHVRVTSLC